MPITTIMRPGKIPILIPSPVVFSSSIKNIEDKKLKFDKERYCSNLNNGIKNSENELKDYRKILTNETINLSEILYKGESTIDFLGIIKQMKVNKIKEKIDDTKKIIEKYESDIKYFRKLMLDYKCIE